MATLTAVGAVNCTTSTNWSPAQIPADGDDIIVGAFLFTLDANRTFNTVTFNNASGRLAISGTSRIVTATNGWFLSAALTTALCATALPVGTTVELYGTWTNTLAVAAAFTWFTSVGGNLKLATIGDDPAAVLLSCPGATLQQWQISSSWAGGTLTTIGRVVAAAAVPTGAICTISAGTWTHNSSGLNSFGPSLHRLCVATGTASVSWSGDVVSQTSFAGLIAAVSGLFSWSSSGTLTINGDLYATASTATAGSVTSIVSAGSGTVNISGRLRSNANGAVAIHTFGTGVVNYLNQTVTIPAGDRFAVASGSGTVNMSGLKLMNSGKVHMMFYGSSVLTTSGTSEIANQVATAQASVFGASGFDATLTNVPSPAPTLPAVGKVESGTVYGYGASPLTGTGLVLNPSTLTTAIDAARVKLHATQSDYAPAKAGDAMTLSGDLTPTMKSSVTAAVPSVVAVRNELDANSTKLISILGAVATDLPAFIAAGLAALNQGAARRIVIATSAGLEIPASGSYAYQIEVRTWDPDGVPTNATALPTVTALGNVSGSMNAKLSSVVNIAAGVYGLTFTVASNDVPQQLTLSVAATMADGAQSALFYSSIMRSVAIDFTASDRLALNAIAAEITTARLAKLDVPGTLAHSDAASLYRATGFSTPADITSAITAIVSEMQAKARLGSGQALDEISSTALARFATVNTGQGASSPGSVTALAGGGSSGGGASDHPLATNG